MALEESQIDVVAVVVVAGCPTTGAVESVEGQHIHFLIPKAHSFADICLSFLIHSLKVSSILTQNIYSINTRA